jgi:hypothetical protein
MYLSCLLYDGRMNPADLEHAAALVAQADLLIAAGAGMGVDSGLPDFRGNQGFWKAYPALAGRAWSSPAWPRPPLFMKTQRWRGDFMAIGSTCTAPPCRMPASRC